MCPSRAPGSCWVRAWWDFYSTARRGASRRCSSACSLARDCVGCNRRLAEVPVQAEPNGVAILPNGSKAYVANTVSGTVSVIPLNLYNGFLSRPTKHIPVGTEPYGLALTPNGKKLYVTNSRSNSV